MCQVGQIGMKLSLSYLPVLEHVTIWYLCPGIMSNWTHWSQSWKDCSILCLIYCWFEIFIPRYPLWMKENYAFFLDLVCVQSPSWQRALRYAPLVPSAIGPISRFLKNHWKGIIKYTIIDHTLSYDNMNLNLFHIWQICENSASNRMVITRIICCGWRRNLV